MTPQKEAKDSKKLARRNLDPVLGPNPDLDLNLDSDLDIAKTWAVNIDLNLNSGPQ